MTAAFLQSELTNLIADSRRKYGDVKTLAERSLADLKAISVTSETQLAGDLIRKPAFGDVFVLALKSSNAKLAITGAACLQRLVASSAIARSKLPDILQAFEEAINLGQDVQLKILQTLPFLLQLYANELHGVTLARTLNVSADLSSSKSPVLSSTASATFQQLVSVVFTRPANGKDEDRDQDAAYVEDAFAIFVDLCGLLADGQSKFVRLDKLPPSAILETIEALLTQHGPSLMESSDVRRACANFLVPGLCTLIEDSSSYAIVVRAYRSALLFITKHTRRLPKSSSDLLRMVLKKAERSTGTRWKRVLSFECMRAICVEFDVLRVIFETFDLREEQHSPVSDLMSLLVRTSSEDPTIIGLGRQSTIPASAKSNATDSTTSSDLPAANVLHDADHDVGISTEWSTMAIRCLDTFDKATPPDVPETYIYTLVLSCTAGFSDGMSKIIMPLSVPSRKATIEIASSDDVVAEQSPARVNTATSKHQQLVNPLTRTEPNKIRVAESCAKMVETCWPAVLAICSTFLNAALDTEYYHLLIRTAQKLTQVSGVLQLDTPRDALLTTLAKASVPANVSNVMNLHCGSKPALHSELAHEDDDEETSLKSPLASTPRHSIDLSTQSLNLRNLLCLRALLNLGIALGPTLSPSAWTIILQSLQQVEALMSVGPTARILQSTTSLSDTIEGSSTNLATEIKAVDTARRRMVESTRTYADTAFASLCQALWNMVEDILQDMRFSRKPNTEVNVQKPKPGNGTLRPATLQHRSTRSVSGAWTKTAILEVDVCFVLITIGRLASENLLRFLLEPSHNDIWDLIVGKLLILQANRKLLPHLRVQSAHIVDAIVVETCKRASSSVEFAENDIAVVTDSSIAALRSQIETLDIELQNGNEDTAASVKIAQSMLEALHNIVGHCGEQLEGQWQQVLETLTLAVTQAERLEPEGRKILHTAVFKTVQLVISDFLANLDQRSMMALLCLTNALATRTEDLNMALTISALYWNIASLLVQHLPEGAINRLDIPVDSTEDIQYQGLWRQLLGVLESQAQDPRNDIRNAALRMLLKVIEASVSLLTHDSLLSCFQDVLIPLLVTYCLQSKKHNGPWNDSIQQCLAGIQALAVTRLNLLVKSNSFHVVWQQLVDGLSQTIHLKDVQLTAAVYDLLDRLISRFCATDADDSDNVYVDNTQVAEHVWKLWKHNPSADHTQVSNEDVLAAHLRLLLKLLECDGKSAVGHWEHDLKISRSISTTILSARHDQYTLDVRKMSKEQDLALQAMCRLQGLFESVDLPTITFTQAMIILVNDLTDRSLSNTTNQSSQVQARVPTGIAFATSCLHMLASSIHKLRDDKKIWSKLPMHELLDLSIKLTATKHGELPQNEENPIWQRACSLGVKCVETFRIKNSGAFDQVRYKFVRLATTILEAHNLNIQNRSQPPSQEAIIAAETFDTAQLKALHYAIVSSYEHLHGHITKEQYIELLFKHSLVAKPAYNDLTPDIKNNPLQKLTIIRRGSIKAPIIPIRREIYLTALDCLFSLVSIDTYENDGMDNPRTTSPSTARIAAPLIILRVAHSLKTFIADQPLRYLEPPHKKLQEDLHFVLKGYINIDAVDDAFSKPADILHGAAGGPDLTKSNDSDDNDATYDVREIVRFDGRTHLRLLYRLMLKFEEVWYKMPRLDVGAWQEDEHGKGIEACLKQWKMELSSKWGPAF